MESLTYRFFSVNDLKPSRSGLGSPLPDLSITLPAPWKNQRSLASSQDKLLRKKKTLIFTARASNTSAVQFSSSLGTDIPFRETFGVPFEDYLKEDKRVLRAFFPDEQRSEQLSADTWRIYMLPIGFFFLSVRPVVDIKLQLMAEEYSNQQPQVLTLTAVQWELRGADILPRQFVLSVNGALFAEKNRVGKRLRGEMNVGVNFDIPDNLKGVPPEIIESVGSAVMEQLLLGMKDKVNSRVLEDYAKFAREKSMAARKLAGH